MEEEGGKSVRVGRKGCKNKWRYDLVGQEEEREARTTLGMNGEHELFIIIIKRLYYHVCMTLIDF